MYIVHVRSAFQKPTGRKLYVKEVEDETKPL